MAGQTLAARLEQYTLKRPSEVLLVTIRVDGEPDQLVIFRGFSSSLMRPTAFDPDVPMLPDQADILAIDRLEGPYDPSNPRIIQQDITRAQMESLLKEIGL